MHYYLYYTAFIIALLAHQSYFIPYIDYPLFDKMMAIVLVLFVWTASRENDSKGHKIAKALILGLFIAKAFKHIFGNPYNWESLDYWFAFFAAIISFAEYKGWLKTIKNFILKY